MTMYEENYIKSIYEKTESKETIVKASEIAEEFGYSNQSVIEMFKKMDARGYLEYIPYKGVRLTAEGKNIGARMVRIHRLWEVFLIEQLNMKWDEVDIEAHQLEHATSKLLEEKLYEYLGKPVFCPHGNLIPDENGNTISVEYTSLDKVCRGDTFAVKKVKDEPSLLKYLDRISVKIGSQIYIESVIEYDGMICGNCQAKEIFISKDAANLIYGLVMPKEE